MTAEIGVMNRLGVALAADSAVTIGGASSKTYASSEKLFQLSAGAPIGAMVYGNATFLSLPWETIIKVFRKRLGEQFLPKTVDYAERFIDLLQAVPSIFPKESEPYHVVQLIGMLFTSIRTDIEAALDEEAQARGGLTAADLPPVCGRVITERLAAIRKRPLLANLGKTPQPNVRKTYSRIAKKVRKQVFGNLPLSASSLRGLSSCAIEMLVRRYFGPMDSGLVIAGFGQDEYMPVVVHYRLEQKVIGRVRLFRVNITQITEDSDASILAFAQREAVTTFLEGVDESIRGEMERSTRLLFTGAIDALLQAVSKADPKLAQQLTAATKPGIVSLLTSVLKDWKAMRDNYWRPIVNIVSALPKDELAAMAEALVNLTKFRRRVSPELETVGGPIDVAVITKGDGFVWVRRKHYFDPALNPRALSRLSRES